MRDSDRPSARSRGFIILMVLLRSGRFALQALKHWETEEDNDQGNAAIHNTEKAPFSMSGYGACRLANTNGMEEVESICVLLSVMHFRRAV